MKKILLFELCLVFLATNFQSGNPPGWYQQTLPVNDFVNDIFFLDTLTGWVVTQGHTNNQDTAYIMKTTNGGDNWIVQYARNMNTTTVQFTDQQTGYVGGASGTGTIYVLKTTNGGDNWTQIMGTTAGTQVDDMFFLNSDTGWICDSPNLIGFGLIKTTNGGLNWFQQLDNSYRPLRVHFINSDTGWVINNHEIYQTINSGLNWQLKADIGLTLRDVFFINGNSGWVTRSGKNGIFKTTNGGANWIQKTDPDPTGSGLSEIYFTSMDSGYIASGFNGILKTTNGETWGIQQTPYSGYNNVFFVNEYYGWAAGNNNIAHTTDAGGPISNIQQMSHELPSHYTLFQNYPNPFNPETTIEFELKKTSDISLQIYDISGRTIGGIGYTNKSPGKYKYIYIAEGLTTGIYFYRLLVNGITIDTKKMILVK